MLALQRQLEILKLLKTNGSTRVADLAKRFEITEETVRRDLDRLEETGKAIRIHGGAMPAQDPGAELPHWQRELANMEEKRAIAKEAVARVEEGDRILLDASSTAGYMASHLPNIPLTVVTNAIQVALSLSEHHHVRVMMIGGTLSRKSLSFQGALAQDTLKKYEVDKLFISGKTFDVEKGLRDDNEQHAMLKQDMMLLSTKRYLLVDSSKFGSKALTLVADINDFDELITDDQVDPSAVKQIEEHGIKITRVTVDR